MVHALPPQLIIRSRYKVQYDRLAYIPCLSQICLFMRLSRHFTPLIDHVFPRVVISNSFGQVIIFNALSQPDSASYPESARSGTKLCRVSTRDDSKRPPRHHIIQTQNNALEALKARKVLL